MTLTLIQTSIYHLMGQMKACNNQHCSIYSTFFVSSNQ